MRKQLFVATLMLLVLLGKATAADSYGPGPISGLPFADFLVAKYFECISDVRGQLYFFIECDLPVLRSSNATENGRTTSQSSKHTVPISYTVTLYYKYRCSLIVLSTNSDTRQPKFLFSGAHQIASIVEGGLAAMLYVTLTMPGTSRIISSASLVRMSNESCVGFAVRASRLSQQRSSICWPKSRLPSRIPVTRSS